MAVLILLFAEQAKNLTVANLKKMKKTIEKQRKADDPLSALDR